MSKGSCIALVGMTVVALAVSGEAWASDCSWTNTGSDGLWTDSGNWDGGVPGSGDSAYIDGGTANLSDDAEGQCSNLYVGQNASGALNVTAGAGLSNGNFYMGHNAGVQGTVTFDGDGTTLSTNNLCVGLMGTASLQITNGAYCEITASNIGYMSGSQGTATVDGSVWAGDALYVGFLGTGALEIANGGRVQIANELSIDYSGMGASAVNMATGGMLALSGDHSTDLADFLSGILGSDAINYWDGDSYENITGATEGVDYWIDYDQTVSGYTTLTVGVPEPTTLGVLALGGWILAMRRRR